VITARIDAITHIPVKYMTPTPPAPRSVKIELTGRCNYRCGFCALRTRKHQPTQDMDFDLFRRITVEMKDAGVEEIGVFYLGESTMNPALLVQAISHVKRIGIPYCFLTTNGSLMEPALANDCMEAGLDSLKFSINAGDEDQFKAVMGVKTRLFGDALDNLKAAWNVRNEKGYACKVYASSIKYDGEQQERMMSLLRERVLPYVDEHYWLPLYSMGSLATQREAELGYRPTAGNQGRLDAMRDPLPCWSAFTEGHVTASGKLSACCFDADDRWTMGDLTREPFMQAWNSDAFTGLRAAHLKRDVKGTPCEQCVAYS
jgi:MoaA/NifB/PqqE/SkfB family radical SAM enzyme